MLYFHKFKNFHNGEINEQSFSKRYRWIEAVSVCGLSEIIEAFVPASDPPIGAFLQLFEPDLSHVYLAYTAEGAEQALRPKTGKKGSGRPKTASSRPKSSKKWVNANKPGLT